MLRVVHDGHDCLARRLFGDTVSVRATGAVGARGSLSLSAVCRGRLAWTIPLAACAAWAHMLSVAVVGWQLVGMAFTTTAGWSRAGSFSWVLIGARYGVWTVDGYFPYTFAAAVVCALAPPAVVLARRCAPVAVPARALGAATFTARMWAGAIAVRGAALHRARSPSDGCAL